LHVACRSAFRLANDSFLAGLLMMTPRRPDQVALGKTHGKETAIAPVAKPLPKSLAGPGSSGSLATQALRPRGQTKARPPNTTLHTPSHLAPKPKVWNDRPNPPCLFGACPCPPSPTCSSRHSTAPS
jgi:hypothetical protein